MNTGKVIVIDATGTLKTLYADDLPDLGDVAIVRASQVEPTTDSKHWCVRLLDIEANGAYRGMFIGEYDSTVKVSSMARLFCSRADALAAEVSFIQRFILEGRNNANTTTA